MVLSISFIRSLNDLILWSCCPCTFLRQTVLFIFVILMNSFGEITHSMILKIFINYKNHQAFFKSKLFLVVNYSNFLIIAYFFSFLFIFSCKYQINAINSDADSDYVQKRVKYFSKLFWMFIFLILSMTTFYLLLYIFCRLTI